MKAANIVHSRPSAFREALETDTSLTRADRRCSLPIEFPRLLLSTPGSRPWIGAHDLDFFADTSDRIGFFVMRIVDS
jgi:hypothetical protein